MWHSKSKETQLKSHAHLSGSASRSPQNQLICVKAREAQILQKKCELMECQGALKLKAIFTVFTSSWRWKSRPRAVAVICTLGFLLLFSRPYISYNN